MVKIHLVRTTSYQKIVKSTLQAKEFLAAKMAKSLCSLHTREHSWAAFSKHIVIMTFKRLCSTWRKNSKMSQSSI